MKKQKTQNFWYIKTRPTHPFTTYYEANQLS